MSGHSMEKVSIFYPHLRRRLNTKVAYILTFYVACPDTHVPSKCTPDDPIVLYDKEVRATFYSKMNRYTGIHTLFFPKREYFSKVWPMAAL